MTKTTNQIRKLISGPTEAARRRTIAKRRAIIAQFWEPGSGLVRVPARILSVSASLLAIGTAILPVFDAGLVANAGGQEQTGSEDKDEFFHKISGFGSFRNFLFVIQLCFCGFGRLVLGGDLDRFARLGAGQAILNDFDVSGGEVIDQLLGLFDLGRLAVLDKERTCSNQKKRDRFAYQVGILRPRPCCRWRPTFHAGSVGRKGAPKSGASPQSPSR